MPSETLKRKFALLRHPANAYLIAGALEYDKDKISRIPVGPNTKHSDIVSQNAFGVNSSTLLSTITGGSPQHRTKKAIVDVSNELRDKKDDNGQYKYPFLRQLKPIEPRDLSDDGGGSDQEVYDFARKLGYSFTEEALDIGAGSFTISSDGQVALNRLEVFKALDSELASYISPMYGQFYTQPDIESIYEEYKGVYALYYPVIIDQDIKLYFKSTLRVSHVLEREHGARVIKLKLNMPNLMSGNENYYQYRGQLIPMSRGKVGFNQLSFELMTQTINGEALYSTSDVSVVPDFLTIMAHGMTGEHSPFTGLLTSINQRKDMKRRTPYSSYVVLKKQMRFIEKMSNEERSEAEHHFMQKGMRLFDSVDELEKEDEDGAEIARILRENPEHNDNIIAPI